MSFVVGVKADDHISEPFTNYEGYVREPYAHTSMILPVTGDMCLVDPYTGEFIIRGNGDGTFTYCHPVFITADTYVAHSSSMGDPFDPSEDSITITDIWAVSLDPNHEPNEIPEQTGFDPLDPQQPGHWCLR